MKSIPLALLCLTISGCTLPEKAYHAIKLSHERSGTLPVDQLRTAVAVSSQAASSFAPVRIERVLLHAHFLGGDAADSDKSKAAAQQIVASIVGQELLNKGYQVASLLNLPPVQMEQAFPSGRVTRGALESLFKGSHLLLITMSRGSAGPKQYEWREGLEGTEMKWFVGTQASFHLSAELIDVQTFRSLWVAQVRLDRVLRGEIPHGFLFDQMLRILAETLPARTPSTASPETPILEKVEPGSPSPRAPLF